VICKRLCPASFTHVSSKQFFRIDIIVLVLGTLIGHNLQAAPLRESVLTTENKPLISVIMNCFNGAAYLRESISSVRSQTYENWELVFWDNCSTDESMDIVRAVQDSRLKCFSALEHTSLGLARKLALEKATGDWVGFLDVDDLWFPEKLSEQMNAIQSERSAVGLVYSRCVILEGSKKHTGRVSQAARVLPSCKSLPQSCLAEKLFLGNLIPFPSILYKRKVLSEIGGFPNYDHPPDYYMSLSIALKHKAIAVDKILCAYRIHKDNLSAKIPEQGYLEPIDIVKKLAPQNRHAELSRYNKMRYIFFLLKRHRWFDAYYVSRETGLINCLVAIMALVKYKREYHRAKR
jgi:glycosyltransferase involved in cell wall biosynthesis